MGWFSGLGDGMSKSFATLPNWCQSIGKIALWLSFGIFALVSIAEITYSTIARAMPVTAQDVQGAERKVELERLNAEAIEASRLVGARAKAQMEIEAAKVESNRVSLGLPPKVVERSSDGLAALGEIATAHLPTILAIMFAVHLLPTFSSTGDPWRLALNISAAIILSGLFALIKGINAPATVEAKGSIGTLAVTSTSVGLCLMLFGTVLAGFCLSALKKSRSERAADD